MIAPNGKIIVECNPNQKNSFQINGTDFIVPIDFENNYREKCPVLCQSKVSNGVINENDILICHHNTFYGASPYHLYSNLFSIPENGNIIFAKLNVYDGSLFPIYGNMLCDTIDIEGQFALPEKERKKYPNRCIISNSGYVHYKKNDLLFIRPYGWYEIVYNWRKELIRTCKVHESQVCGIYKEN